ncbi:MAG: peptide ABC transporter substrate-binding protein, partial [bacterium]|nr:peptide ABC transporter substrate-binding protein [bacterium]
IERLEIIDPHTVKIKFKTVNPAWTLPFIGTPGLIIPRHIFESYNGPNARNAPANILPVGTGPYRVISPGIKPQEVMFLGSQIVKTNKIVFESNPYFREKNKPFFRKIVFRGGGTKKEASRSVIEGKTDFIYAMSGIVNNPNGIDYSKKVINYIAKVERIMLNRTDSNRETEEGERSSLKFTHPLF